MSAGNTTQTTIGGEQLEIDPHRPSHVNGIAAVLWEVGADPPCQRRARRADC
ncbi:hypothetical protein GJ633_09405 [Halorubrum sp. CBA1125]|uniref:hypothetical protein n=1 Tax=Halorubrum sp. CBA1125 TaxID=2668072 RepID=UPI0012E7716B|nr:hypothetical protein [Halorubrum sp. CBA1125]MUW14856.1 hypothetical protein [Halorubrum sp. CBA1125]